MPEASPGKLSPPYWVLFVLVFVYAVNFIDRSVIYVVQEHIKQEFHLTDAQMGLLGGPAFGFFYAIFGIPLARLAEYRNRSRIIAASAAAWSVMTAVCGLVGNFTQLLIARSFVAIGESGSTPPSHSIIGDYFPQERRGGASGLFTAAVPIGMLVGSAVGGLLSDQVGWRMTFVIMAIPGLIGALLTLTIKEPPRGHADKLATDEAVPTIREVLALSARTPAYLHVVAAMCVHGFCVYSIMNFTSAFMIRRFGLDAGSAGTAFGLIYGVAGGIGIVLGGFLADRFGKHDLRMYGYIPAICLALATPFFVLGFAQSSAAAATAFLVVAGLFHTMNIAAGYSVVHRTFSSRMRATAVALIMLGSAVLGMSFGPPIVGLLSDTFAAAAFGGDYAGTCAKGAVLAECRVAAGIGIQKALMWMSPVFLWAALHYVFVARALAPKAVRAGPFPAPSSASV